MRYIASFDAQVWVNGAPFSIDPQGDTDWDCTAYLASPPMASYRDGILHQLTAEGEAGPQMTIALRDDPAAPDWIRTHTGRFSITVYAESSPLSPGM